MDRLSYQDFHAPNCVILPPADQLFDSPQREGMSLRIVAIFRVCAGNKGCSIVWMQVEVAGEMKANVVEHVLVGLSLSLRLQYPLQIRTRCFVVFRSSDFASLA